MSSKLEHFHTKSNPPEILEHRATRQANGESPPFRSEFIGEIGNVFGQRDGEIVSFENLDGSFVGIRHGREIDANPFEGGWRLVLGKEESANRKVFDE